MMNRLLVAGFWIGLAFSGVFAAVAQTSRHATSKLADESGARATLAVDSVRLELPLNGQAVAGERAVAWFLSPKGMPSGERAVDLTSGAHAAIIDLPRPKDEHGQKVKELGWYRIAYRVEAGGAPVAQGVLAVGAITPNLMELRIARPGTLTAGKPIQIRVYAGNPITRKSFQGVRLQATLVLDSDSTDEGKSSKRTVLREATTDKTGEAMLTFPKKDAVIESASVTVHGSMKSANGGYAEATVDADLTQYDRASVRIDADKPLHKPGEVVHLRALIFAFGQVMANHAVTLTISDPENKTLLEAPLTTNRFGIAAYDWKTGNQLATGNYTADFTLDKTENGRGSGRTTIPIQHYDLPEFSISVAMDYGYYLEGQTPVAHIHAGYLFGKPVAAGSVRVAHVDDQEWNPKTREWEKKDEPEQTATLDANGNADVRLDVKKDYDEFKASDYERYSDVKFRAIVTDQSSGRSEPLKFAVRLTRDPVHIYLRHLDGNESEGEFVVTTSHADGGPVACKVTLEWLDDDGHLTPAASATTNRYGLAKVHLSYPRHSDDSYHQYKIRLAARNSAGLVSKFDDTAPSDARPVWFTVAHTLLTPHQPIEALIHAPKGITLDVDLYSIDGLLQHRQIHMAHVIEPVEFPASNAFHGQITLTACQMNRDLSDYSYIEPCSFKSVLYPEDRALKLKLDGLRPSYLPGAEVNAGVNLQGSAGVVGISVFDKAVEQRATTEEDENDRWSRSMWWQDDSNVSGVTVDDLNRIDTSKPIPAELDLVAETLIGNSAVQELLIQNNHEDNESERSTYESAMQESLKQVGEAVLAARPERLPATLETVRSITRAAKLDDVLLLDP